MHMHMAQRICHELHYALRNVASLECAHALCTWSLDVQVCRQPKALLLRMVKASTAGLLAIAYYGYSSSYRTDFCLR